MHTNELKSISYIWALVKKADCVHDANYLFGGGGGGGFPGLSQLRIPLATVCCFVCCKFPDDTHTQLQSPRSLITLITAQMTLIEYMT